MQQAVWVPFHRSKTGNGRALPAQDQHFSRRAPVRVREKAIKRLAPPAEQSFRMSQCLRNNIDFLRVLKKSNSKQRRAILQAADNQLLKAILIKQCPKNTPSWIKHLQMQFLRI